MATELTPEEIDNIPSGTFTGEDGLLYGWIEWNGTNQYKITLISRTTNCNEGTFCP